MENEINITPPVQPEQIPIQPKSKTWLIVLLIIFGVAVAGYFVSAKFLSVWPFFKVTTISPSPSPSVGITDPYLNNLVSKVMDWNSYKPLNKGNEYVGSDPCNGETQQQIKEMDDYMTRVNADVNIKNITIGTLDVFYTPNYQHWSAQQFISYKGACSAGSPLTLYAYPDKVVWLDSCYMGVTPEDDDPDKQAILNAQDKCIKDRDLLLNYFKSLP